MPYDTPPSSADLFACFIAEILSVLESANAQGFVRPEGRATLDDLKAHALFGAANLAKGRVGSPTCGRLPAA
jgi:hypothetical protein